MYIVLWSLRLKRLKSGVRWSKGQEEGFYQWQLSALLPEADLNKALMEQEQDISLGRFFSYLCHPHLHDGHESIGLCSNFNLNFNHIL